MFACTRTATFPGRTESFFSGEKRNNAWQLLESFSVKIPIPLANAWPPRSLLSQIQCEVLSVSKTQQTHSVQEIRIPLTALYWRHGQWRGKIPSAAIRETSDWRVDICWWEPFHAQPPTSWGLFRSLISFPSPPPVFFSLITHSPLSAYIQCEAALPSPACQPVLEEAHSPR